MAAQTSSTTRGVYCDDAHPYRIPNWQVHVQWTTDDNFVAGKWHLASDEMVPGFVVGPNSPIPAGYSAHMDYFDAQSAAIKDAWFNNCINGHLTAANGNLCNGTQIKDAGQPVGGFPRHILVPVP
jgi:hypothetical protein